MGEQDTKSIWLWSWTISVLVALASVLGLTNPGVYGEETANWAAQARGQDVGNLVAVVVLLISGRAGARGSHRAALVWLGTLLYLAYAYTIYSVAVHFNQLFLVYVAVLGLSAYAVMFSVNRLRAESETLPEPAGRRVVGYTSMGIAALFGLLWLSELVPATMSGEVPPSVVEAGLWVNPVHVIDLAILLPAMAIAGWQTLKGRAVGQFFAGPLLVFSVLMGTSIVAAMVLMTVEGFEDMLPPLIIVSLVVLASAFAAWRHLLPPRPAPLSRRR
ncbi:hypothetical protein ACFQW6_00925 [Nocardioides sp. GCM10028917]|uniref:hypothetical protein n=1 Tax=Nocardioides sp. GCM10028917 TaxID=3273408 RepID=UPI0036203674